MTILNTSLGGPPTPKALEKGTRIHMCLSVRGALEWPRTLAKRMAEANNTTVEGLSEWLTGHLEQGHEVIPMTAKPCEGFNYKTGCPGHPE